TGKSGRQTRRFLDHMGTEVVDHLVISHQGYDHAGGADEVISTKTVEKVYDNGMISYPDGYLGKAGLSHLGRGDIINGEGYTLEVLHPYKGFYTSFGSPSSSDNNSSLVLRLRYHGVAVLFTGDIEAEAEDDLISTGEYLRSDIIKVPHHGSSTSSSSAFVNAVSPSVAVISSGMFNPYGHPHKGTIDNLEGVRIINTSEAGAVKISVGGDSDSAVISIKTYESERIGSADSLQDELENIIKLFSVW
ncbi:MAG: MBL fold metallo-hydrolase, partial [Nitrospirota bacterium]